MFCLAKSRIVAKGELLSNFNLKKMNKILKNSELQNNETNITLPITLQFGPISSLFFTEEGINELLKSKIIHLPNAKTVNGISANLIFRLDEVDDEFFELRCVIITPYGTEYFDVNDYINKLTSFNLKSWMHLCTCLEDPKKWIIEKFPERYDFDENIRLHN
jgi:hypothetical protein